MAISSTMLPMTSILKYITLEISNAGKMHRILTIIGALVTGGISIAVMGMQPVQAALTQN